MSVGAPTVIVQVGLHACERLPEERAGAGSGGAAIGNAALRSRCL